MSLLDLRVARRQMAAAPLHTLASLGGLALALAACLLLSTLIADRLLPDRQLQDPDRIVLIDFKGNMPDRQEDWFLRTPFAFYDALRQARAPLTDLGRYVEARRRMQLSGVGPLDEGRELLTAAMDPTLARLFALRSLQGDAQEALSRPDRIVVTEAFARRSFGRVEVLDQPVRLGLHTLTIGAVVASPSPRHPVQAELMVNFDSPAAGLGQELKTAWFFMNGQVWGRLAPGASTTQLGALAQSLLDHSPVIAQLPPDWVADGRKAAFMRALPLSAQAFEGRAGQAQRQVLTALLGAALLLCVLALVNAVNLGGVRMLQRQREMAIRKSLGASPASLLGLSLAEAGLQSLLAGGLGLLLAWLLAPWMADVLELPAPEIVSWPGLLLALGLMMLSTLVIAAYPAWLAWRLRSAEALQGRLAGEGRSGPWLRRLFGGLQFGSALLVLAMALTVWGQNAHVLRRELGYQPQGLLALTLPDGTSRTQLDALRESLARLPGVQGMAWTAWILGSGREVQEARLERPPLQTTARVQLVDADFFELYRVRPLAGRIEPPSTAEQRLVIDTLAAKALGWADPRDAIGQRIPEQARGLDQSAQYSRIVAVIAHLALESTREAQLPQAFRLQLPPEQASEREAGVLNVRTLAPLDEGALKALWARHFPQQRLQLERLADTLMEPYTQDLRLGRLVTLCAVLALAIAGFGIYALSAHLVQRHAREIVLRKLHGAGPWQALGRMGRELALLLLAGTLLGVPLSWALGQLYLGGFADRAALGAWPQFLALTGLLAVAALASLRHGLQAMALRPIAALHG
ncbi:ABC transporter permease [Mitsuaria sp. WAJ17]|uniref:FtsX-like permease family protein n=1 Tax=Mitsuaria sp. WAJ17 TaxID=2761452 RepID=UPI001603D056|nr:FtsX-like permease family protein [Mitsuaria sp. WAJ17]MBB2487270.1 ABC transporter permease [Mitsuaria sp. WAJ17]